MKQFKLSPIGFSYHSIGNENYQIKLFWAFVFSKIKGGFWVRFFGKGFSVKNTKTSELLFGERNGLSGKVIGNLLIKSLG